jgi:hypothetical protein
MPGLEIKRYELGINIQNLKTQKTLIGKPVFLTYTPIATSIGWTSIDQATTNKNSTIRRRSRLY